MRRFAFISAILIAVLSGCSKEGVEKGRGSLRLSLNQLDASFETKAGTPEEGYAFHNLLVILTDEQGRAIDKIYKEYTSPLPTHDEVSFVSLEVGTYRVYAYANIDHVDWQDGTIASIEKEIQTLKDDLVAGNLDTDHTLKDFSSGTAPALPAEGQPMLLTGQTTVPVGVSVNEAEIALLRPVARLNVRINNHTPFALKVKDLSFSEFNASKSYLLPHRDEDGRYVLPPGSDYISLPALENEVTIPVPSSSAESDDGEMVYSTLLYESEAPSYKMYIKVELQDEASGNPIRELRNASGRSGRLMTREEILAMTPGQSKSVLLLNPQYNGNGRMLGWNGSSIMLKSAPSIKEPAEYQNWVDASLLESGIEKYFITLTKLENGKYRFIFADGHNLFDNLTTSDKTNSGTGNEVSVENKNWATGKQISTAFDPNLIRLSTVVSNKSYYLWIDNNTSIKLHSGSNHQTRHWALYELTDVIDGVTLKYVENESHQERLLTRIGRNQDLSLMLNVYYVDFDTQFNFRVENTWWTDEGGHKMTHTFE